jgi:hypothetical protein
MPYADHLAIHNALNQKLGGKDYIKRFDTRSNGVRRTALLLSWTNLTLAEAARLADCPTTGQLRRRIL